MRNEGPRSRVANVGLALLVFSAGLMALLPTGDMTVQAASIPSNINGDWNVNSYVEYDGGNCVLDGSLTVESGGTLVLKNLTLALDNEYEAEHYIYVDNNGTLKVLDSTIKSNTNQKSAYLESWGTLQIERSTMRDFGPDWWWTGVSVYMGNAVIRNSTFTSNDIGLRHSGGSLTLEDCNFTNNMEGGIMFEMSSPTVRNLTLTGNGAAGGGYGGAVWVSWMAYPTLYNITAKNNLIAGLYMEEASVDVFNSTFKSNQNDVQMESWGGSNEANFYNVDYTTAALDQWGMGSGSTIHVHWFANVSATWASDGAPATYADLDVYDKNEGQVMENQLDAGGKATYLAFKEYEHKSTGKTYKAPYTFVVSGTREGKVRSGEVTDAFSDNVDIDVVLDDLPPILNITYPAEGLATNKMNVAVEGKSEVGATVYVNDVLTAIDGTGGFSTTVELDVEGLNTIRVKASDDQGNEASAVVNVTRDTILPDLTIDTPIEGAILNYSDVEVRGTTEVGADLTVKGTTVTVNDDGTYNITLSLPEGATEIVVKSKDAVGNMAEARVNVTVDVTAPYISVMEPYANFITKEVSIRVVGSAEAKATVTVNNLPVPLSGQMYQTNVNLVEGENTIVVRACDVAKNCDQVTISGTRDSTPPALTITEPASKDEILVNREEVVIMGMTEPDAVVYVDGYEVDVHVNGSFETTVFLEEGPNTVTIRAEDPLGNAVSATRKFRVDTVPPGIDVTAPSDGTWTRETSIKVEGTVEGANSMTMDGNEVDILGGQFSETLDLPDEGVNEFVLTAVDLAGNEKSVTIQVNRDTMIELVLESPTDGIKTKNETVTVKGVTDPEAAVKINDLELTADRNGRFRTDVTLEIGENTINVTVTDDLGNTRTVSVTVTRAKKSSGGGGGGTAVGGDLMLPIIIIVIVAIVVVALAMVMRKRGKGKSAEETAPPPEEAGAHAPAPGPQVQPGPHQNGYGGNGRYNPYNNGGRVPPPGRY